MFCQVTGTKQRCVIMKHHLQLFPGPSCFIYVRCHLPTSACMHVEVPKPLTCVHHLLRPPAEAHDITNESNVPYIAKMGWDGIESKEDTILVQCGLTVRYNKTVLKYTLSPS